MTDKFDSELSDELGARVLEDGEPLVLSDEVRALLRRSAEQVALSPGDADEALRSVPTATTLLQEISRRFTEGSKRLFEASNKASDLRDAGDLDGACRQMEDVLAVEVVPLYSQRAADSLHSLTRLKSVAASGQIDPTLRDRSQLPILLHRVRQGHQLELNEAMRAFLRRSSADVGMSEAETEEALALLR
jgi:DUSAM domain-containing protein